MPKVKLIEVKGYTCQDDKYPAENLTTEGKWLNSLPSKNTSMEATFQLAHRTKINAMDIGNCGSAFVSVLVSRTGCSEFKTLLPSSSFMTMKESKLNHNRTAVRMFRQDNFTEDVRNEKWDHLRVVCSQPFNLHVQFGLSFIHLFEFEEVRKHSIHEKSASTHAIPQDVSPHTEEVELIVNKPPLNQNDLMKRWFKSRDDTNPKTPRTNTVQDGLDLLRKRGPTARNHSAKMKLGLNHNDRPSASNPVTKERVDLHTGSSTSHSPAMRKRLEMPRNDGPSTGRIPQMNRRNEVQHSSSSPSTSPAMRRQLEMPRNDGPSTSRSPEMNRRYEVHRNSSPAMRRQLEMHRNDGPSTSRSPEMNRRYEVHRNSSPAMRRQLEMPRNDGPSTSRSPEMNRRYEVHRNSSPAMRRQLEMHRNDTPEMKEPPNNPNLATRTQLDNPSTSRSSEMNNEIHNSSSSGEEWFDLHSKNGPSTSHGSEMIERRKLHDRDVPTTSRGSSGGNSAQEEYDLFETIVVSFMDSIHLLEMDFTKITILDLRLELEKCTGQELSAEQRPIFIKLVNKYLLSLDLSSKISASTSVQSDDLNGDISPAETVPDHCSSPELGNRVQKKKNNSKINSSGNDSGLLQTTCSEDFDRAMNSPSVCRQVQSKSLSDSYSRPSTSNGESSQYAKEIFGGTKRKLVEHNDTAGSKQRVHVFDSDDSSDGVSEYVDPKPRNKDGGGDMVECPVCYVFYNIDEIVVHTSLCSSKSKGKSVKKNECSEKVTCPICKESVTSTSIAVHADICAEKMFGE